MSKTRFDNTRKILEDLQNREDSDGITARIEHALGELDAADQEIDKWAHRAEMAREKLGEIYTAYFRSQPQSPDVFESANPEAIEAVMSLPGPFANVIDPEPMTDEEFKKFAEGAGFDPNP